MLHFVYKQTGYLDEFFGVSEPKKDANGYYRCKKEVIQIPIKAGKEGLLNLNNFTTFTGLDNMIVPYNRFGMLNQSNNNTGNVVSLQATYENQLSTHKYKYFVSNRYDYTYILTKLGKDTSAISEAMNNTIIKSFWSTIVNETDIANNVKSFVNTQMDKSNNINYIDYFKLNNTGELWYMNHKKGEWSANVIVEYNLSSQSMMKIYTLNASLSSNGKLVINSDSGKLERSKNSSVQTRFKIVSFTVDVNLKFNSILLSDKNNWEIGAVMDSSNENNYCFYSNGSFGLYSDLDVSKKTHTVLEYLNKSFPLVSTKDRSLVHNCKNTHGGVSGGTAQNTGTGVTSNGKLTYQINGAIDNMGEKIGKLQFGTTGEYKDGVATVPYVMIELRSPNNPNSEDFFNLSVPAESFVSLVHERNLQDQYNTFKLQLYDKDAMQVESKLLLGFRAITFYYTDFVSTSKRFRGEVLNYQTVITGKGLMLTLEGYTSNLKVYTGQDSIPWSIFFEIQDYAFFYWTNKAGEYHGPVRVLTDDKAGINWLNTSKSYWQGLTYTGTDGELIPAVALRKNNNSIYEWIDTGKGPVYSLKTSVDNETKYETYDKFYEKVTDVEKKELYRPYPELFSLHKYYENIESGIGRLGSDTVEAFQKRPSNVVRLICIINGWKFLDEHIVKTREAVIPDQVSESYLEYIEKKLVPISESMNGDTQFVFWFDDDGYAHYEPMLGTNKPKKSLYFNSGERKDSYPLIGFTAATNGATLMQADASNIISSINIYTGEEYDLSKVNQSDNPILTKQIHQTEEWYATNIKINEKSNLRLKSYSYQNTSVIPSEDDLRKQLTYRYGLVAKYSYNASLEVYACADISPGDTIAVYIYINDGERSNAKVSSENPNSKTDDDKYIGNLTMHHSSGTYIVQKITDTISAGRYVSSMNVLKVDSDLLDSINSSVGTYETYQKLTEEEKRLANLPKVYEIKENEGTVISVDPNSPTMKNILTWKNQ